MPTRFACPCCKAKLTVDAAFIDLIGKKIRCGSCKETFVMSEDTLRAEPARSEVEPEPQDEATEEWRWLKRDETQARGPMSLAALQAALAAGEASPEDHVWHPRLGDAWALAHEVQELAAFIAPRSQPEGPAKQSTAAADAADTQSFEEVGTGERATDVFRVIVVEHKTMRGGEPFVRVVLRDRSGKSWDARVWADTIGATSGPLKDGALLRVWGVREEHRSNPQIRIERVELVEHPSAAEPATKAKAEQRSPGAPATRPERPDAEATSKASPSAKSTCDALFIVGRPTAFLLTTCARAFTLRKVIFDPTHAGDINRITAGLGVGVARDYLAAIPRPKDMEALFLQRAAQAPSEHFKFVVSEAATPAEVLGAIGAARALSADVLYVSDGDESTLWDLASHTSRFSVPIEAPVRDLLALIPQLEIVDAGIDLVDCPAYLPLLARLAKHAQCCQGFLNEVVWRWKNRELGRPIWFEAPGTRGWDHADRVGLGLKEERFIVQRIITGRNGGRGVLLRDEDYGRSLFEQGRWLEFAVAHAVGNVPGIVNVRCNVKVRHDRLLRELDVVASTGSSLLTFECKSGEWTRADLDRLQEMQQRLGISVILVSSGEERALAEAAQERGVFLIAAHELCGTPAEALADILPAPR